MIREEIIQHYASGKDVLDVGSAGQSQPGYLWRMIDAVSRHLTGIDVVKCTHDKRIVAGNMETYRFKKKFDVIVAGDVIEHIDNQGLFLENCIRHLKKNGVLIITTPNAKWISIIFKPNSTHVLWHDYHTMETLIKRHHLKMVKFQYYYGNKPKYNCIKRLLTMRQGMLFVLEK